LQYPKRFVRTKANRAKVQGQRSKLPGQCRNSIHDCRAVRTCGMLREAFNPDENKKGREMVRGCSWLRVAVFGPEHPGFDGELVPVPRAARERHLRGPGTGYLER